MNIGWHHIWGFGLAITGIVFIVKRSVPIGIEGQPPSFRAKGFLAIAIGVACMVVGLVVALDAPKQFRIDSCLDRGGSFDAQKNHCILDTVSTQSP